MNENLKHKNQFGVMNWDGIDTTIILTFSQLFTSACPNTGYSQYWYQGGKPSLWLSICKIFPPSFIFL